MTTRIKDTPTSALQPPHPALERTAPNPPSSAKNPTHHPERENPQNPSHAVDATQTATGYTDAETDSLEWLDGRSLEFVRDTFRDLRAYLTQRLAGESDDASRAVVIADITTEMAEAGKPVDPAGVERVERSMNDRLVELGKSWQQTAAEVWGLDVIGAK